MTTEMLPAADYANLHFVTAQLAVGGDLSMDDDDLGIAQFSEILALGITHVVDVRVEWSDADLFDLHAPHVGYLHHGMDDAGQAVPAEWFEAAVSWVEAVWADDPDAVVLAHCHMGINRGPSLGFAILLAQGWEPVEAIAAIRAARPQANVWVRQRRRAPEPKPRRPPVRRSISCSRSCFRSSRRRNKTQPGAS